MYLLAILLFTLCTLNKKQMKPVYSFSKTNGINNKPNNYASLSSIPNSLPFSFLHTPFPSLLPCSPFSKLLLAEHYSGDVINSCNDQLS